MADGVRRLQPWQIALPWTLTRWKLYERQGAGHASEGLEMVKELTKAEYERAIAKPKRRFRALGVKGGAFTLREPTGAPCYWFQREDVRQEHPRGRYLKIPSLGTITLLVDGTASAFFYLNGRKLDTCTIAYDLTPAKLTKTLAAMQRAKLQRFVLPACRWALEHMPDERRPVLEAALRTVVADARTTSKRRDHERPGRRTEALLGRLKGHRLVAALQKERRRERRR